MGYSVSERLRDVNKVYMSISDYEVYDYGGRYIYEPSGSMAPILVGTVVDCLTRAIITNDYSDSFLRVMRSAVHVGDLGNARELLHGVKGLNKQSVINACKLVHYSDYESSKSRGFNIHTVDISDEVTYNVQDMVLRSVYWFSRLNKFNGCRYELNCGGKYIKTAECDYITGNTVWDLKVLKGEPTDKNALQTAIYYIMLKESEYEIGSKLRNVGIFNPRYNKAYVHSMLLVDDNKIREIRKEVIGL